MMAGRIGGESRGFITGKNVSYTLMAEWWEPTNF
jgi:hypothetical protein